jgi:hypothetical protein
MTSIINFGRFRCLRAVLLLGVLLWLLSHFGGGASAESDNRAAQAANEEFIGEYIWFYNCRYGVVQKDLTRTPRNEDDSFAPVELSETLVRINRKEFDKMLKVFPRLLRQMKACDAYNKCLDDRGAGKVKHCYPNDRRWREFFAGDW